MPEEKKGKENERAHTHRRTKYHRTNKKKL